MNCEKCGQAIPPADDDEPVTEEWLRSVGFKTKEAGTILTIYGGVCGNITVEVTDAGANACLWVCDEEVLWAPSRGQVRMLCRALGIELPTVTK